MFLYLNGELCRMHPLLYSCVGMQVVKKGRMEEEEMNLMIVFTVSENQGMFY